MAQPSNLKIFDIEVELAILSFDLSIPKWSSQEIRISRLSHSERPSGCLLMDVDTRGCEH